MGMCERDQLGATSADPLTEKNARLQSAEFEKGRNFAKLQKSVDLQRGLLESSPVLTLVEREHIHSFTTVNKVSR